MLSSFLAGQIWRQKRRACQRWGNSMVLAGWKTHCEGRIFHVTYLYHCQLISQPPGLGRGMRLGARGMGNRHVNTQTHTHILRAWIRNICLFLVHIFHVRYACFPFISLSPATWHMRHTPKPVTVTVLPSPPPFFVLWHVCAILRFCLCLAGSLRAFLIAYDTYVCAARSSGYACVWKQDPRFKCFYCLLLRVKFCHCHALFMATSCPLSPSGRSIPDSLFFCGHAIELILLFYGI